MSTKVMNFKMEEADILDMKKVAAIYHISITDLIKNAIKEYVDELKEYIRSKKNDADDESGSTYDKEYEKELKSMRKKSSIE